MKKQTFKFKNPEGMDIFVYEWLPKEPSKPKAIVQIVHGYAETAARYERFAKSLTDAGYMVYANDHRGHGNTAGTLEELGHPGDDAFNGIVRDLHQLNHLIKDKYPDLPIFLLGHSMGSFLSKTYVERYDNLNGLILTGTTWEMDGVDMLYNLSVQEVKELGKDAISEKIFQIVFGGSNQPFEPCRTDVDWLSRDNDEVDKYIADPFCGVPFTANFFVDFAKGLMDMNNDENLNNIPKNLPIYIFGGDKDPVGAFGTGVPKSVTALNKLGVRDVTYKLYKDGRHEMLNELNRNEVTKDVINWLDMHM